MTQPMKRILAGYSFGTNEAPLLQINSGYLNAAVFLAIFCIKKLKSSPEKNAIFSKKCSFFGAAQFNRKKKKTETA